MSFDDLGLKADKRRIKKKEKFREPDKDSLRGDTLNSWMEAAGNTSLVDFLKEKKNISVIAIVALVGGSAGVIAYKNKSQPAQQLNQAS